jgi:hypothetical protein
MFTGRFYAIVSAFLLFAASISQAADQGNVPAGLAVYSDMNYIELEGEYVGLQIAVVPYQGGQKVLWRSAGPFIDAPLLLDVTKVGKTFKVVVPEGHDTSGEWKLTSKGNVIDAVGPGDLKYSLKKIALK